MEWHVEAWSPVDGRFFVNDATGTTVAEVMAGDPKIAHLIAAAPELLEALKHAQEIFLSDQNLGNSVDYNDVRSDIETAIHKATGE